MKDGHEFWIEDDDDLDAALDSEHGQLITLYDLTKIKECHQNT